MLSAALLPIYGWGLDIHHDKLLAWNMVMLAGLSSFYQYCQNGIFT
jgi:hypothetical protein